jgi:hypothetical protein
LCLQAANAMVPVFKRLPLFVTREAIKGLEAYHIYQTLESGEKSVE